MTLEERLRARLDKNGPVPPHRPELGPCEVWTGAVNNRGYGVISIDGKLHLTHRVSYAIAHRPIPADVKILHHCDNPPCARRSHLFEGSQLDNVRDSIAKGRFAPHGLGAGSAHPSAKLTEDVVREIRERYANGGITQTALGAEYGVVQTIISAIIKRTSWRHVQ